MRALRCLGKMNLGVWKANMCRNRTVRGNAGDGALQRFIGDRHAMCVRVQNRIAVHYPSHMPAPEQQIAALGRCVGRQGMQRKGAFLQIAIGRAGAVAGVQRHLHQPGTVDPCMAVAAP